MMSGKFLIAAALAACAVATSARATVIFDSITGSSQTSSFGSGVYNSAGQVFATPYNGERLTSLTIQLVSTAATTHPDLRLDVVLFSDLTTATSTNAFSGLLGSFEFRFGANALGSGSVYTIPLTLPAAITIPGNSFAGQFTWLDGVGTAATTLETGLILTSAPTVGSNPVLSAANANVFYAASGVTNGFPSLPATSGLSFGASFPNENLAVIWNATVPEPTSMALLAPAALLLGRRRRV